MNTLSVPNDRIYYSEGRKYTVKYFIENGELNFKEYRSKKKCGLCHSTLSCSFDDFCTECVNIPCKKCGQKKKTPLYETCWGCKGKTAVRQSPFMRGKCFIKL